MRQVVAEPGLRTRVAGLLRRLRPARELTAQTVSAVVGNESTASQPRDPGEPTYTGRYGRYEVLRVLGSGGMGIVLEARDPALDRRVALKLLQPGYRPSVATAARLALEAQGMARLAHPNVVTVFEIDRAGEQAYVAMELVVGTTLGGWLRERPRRWRDVVEMFLGAGRGLAAVHAAGLVHRDFKPDNVLIGSDGRPRLTDFGLVKETPLDEALVEAAGDGRAESQLVGTPAYMSPEQWAGRAVDARSDQFAFCVALWRALYGQPPFAGTQRHELRAAVIAGALSEPDRVASRSLLVAVRRGLAPEPEARWPDMPALLDAMARSLQTGRRRARIALIAGVALASAGVASVAAGARATPDPCMPPTARLTSVWGAERGAALHARLAIADPTQGAARSAQIAAVLDARGQAWSDMYVAACRATRVEGHQSDAMLDRRMDCLDRWLGELGDTVAVVGQAADPKAVDNAVGAVRSLSSLDACADVRALAEEPLPQGEAKRATAIALADQTREATVALRASRLDGLPEKITELVAAARALGHPPTLAGALMAQVRLLRVRGDFDAATQTLHELVDVAALAHDPRAEVFAWTTLISTVAYVKGKPADALAMIPAARAAVLRAGDPVDLHAELLYNQAIALDEAVRLPEAIAALDELKQLLERAGATAPSSPLAQLLPHTLRETARSYLLAENLDASIATARQGLERVRAVFGADHTLEADVWQSLAIALSRAGKPEDALAAIGEAVRIRDARLGASAVLASSLTVQASVLGDLGRWDQAVATFDRAVQIYRATIAPTDLRLGSTLGDRAAVLLYLERFDEAQHDYDEAVALLEAADGKNFDLPTALMNRGELWMRRGRCGDAHRDDARAITMLEALGGPSYYELLYPLSIDGQCLVQQGKPAEAIPVLRRALDRKTSGQDAFEVARATAYLGRALVESRRDIPGGLAMARSARVGIAAAREGAHDLALLDRWLAAHRFDR